MSSSPKFTQIVLAHAVVVTTDDGDRQVPYYYDSATGELAIALEFMPPDERQTIQIDPSSADAPTRTDEEQAIDQLIGLFCALPKTRAVNAHKVLASCPCTPTSICLLDPTGTRWVGLCNKAREQIKSGTCSARDRKNKALLVKPAEMLLGYIPKWLLPKK
jgi:hypothetical protein